MADSKKSDPTITSKQDSPAYPEGTHPAPAPSEGSWGPDRITYKDNPDKPDPTSVAQVAEIADPK